MAIPHCAIAQFGSFRATSSNTPLDSSYWNECRRSTAGSNDVSTVYAPECAKCAEPISSSLSWCLCPSSAHTLGCTIRNITERQRILCIPHLTLGRNCIPNSGKVVWLCCDRALNNDTAAGIEVLQSSFQRVEHQAPG